MSDSITSISFCKRSCGPHSLSPEKAPPHQLTRLPSDYIRDHVRLTTQPIEEPPNDEQFLWLLEQMDAKQALMVSTDYPHWDFDDPIAAFARVPEDLKRRIFFDNAAELYGKKLGLTAAPTDGAAHP